MHEASPLRLAAMSASGTFTTEDTDIVRLDSDREDEVARHGWINVGAHAVWIELDSQGNLLVQAYPLTNETKVLGELRVTKAASIAEGGVDTQSED